MLHHGGRLINAAKQYNIQPELWLDLSTGINPHGWPLVPVPDSVFNRLPEDDDGLHPIAQKYYRAQSLLAIPGSQSVIQLLPKLKPKCKVAVPVLGYAEHQHAWQQAGHQVNALNEKQIDEKLEQYNVLVIINPNNPTGDYYSQQQLLEWHKRLQKNNGWLIIDEAFVDSRPEYSMAEFAQLPGLIVLRSIGKFFGLAGLRSGFVIAEAHLLEKIHHVLGPWTVSGPSRYLTMKALQDESWHQFNILRLKERGEKLRQLLLQYQLSGDEQATVKGTDLFQTLFCNDAQELHRELAKNAVFTRLLDNKQGLRFGLPESSQWLSLEQVFKKIVNSETA
ncbi:L-threonine 3-O-phosphate decarboxylase [hydrothermal vent metagenome]|uniref:threonine-phosphate decarboxylase n=1 Tax=hydrothermal vent metagenome TaxID=652676 RepID=A0A3B0XD94_9ZZZZ